MTLTGRRKLAATTGTVVLGACGLIAFAASAALPPVPVPAENPITEPKRVLGKILFWDEQLSSDNTVACGTCHRPGKGGGDPRQGRHPGADGILGTEDDTFGSPGVAHMDKAGVAREHKIFGMKPQVGDRTAPSNFGNIWSDFLFWDGRAGPKVVDPETGKTVIQAHGALENQVLGPLQNPAEMAKDSRGWADVDQKLQSARPLALASRLPPDTAAAIKAHPTYPDLFRQAFGDPKIDAVRVAEAIAAYERTLVPDQTPYDKGTEPGKPVDPEIQRGMLLLDTAHCTACHKPPLFTDNKFHNIGLRRPYQDEGRGKISGDPADNGRFRTPTLRNSALRASFMHTGEFTDLHKVLDHYVTPKAEAEPLPGTDQPYKTTIEDNQRQEIIDFLANDLTDPRVAAEQFPFDRPILRSERQGGQGAPGRPEDFKAQMAGDVVRLTWTAPKGGAEDYVLVRDGRVIGLPTEPEFEDQGQTPWLRHRYRLVARSDAAASSQPASAGAGLPSLELAGGAVMLLGAGGFWLWRRKRAA
jgi:cytochrome c peroxidase